MARGLFDLAVPAHSVAASVQRPGCISNTLLKLLAEHKMGVVSLSARKRAILAVDALRLVRLRQKPADAYAAVANH